MLPSLGGRKCLLLVDVEGPVRRHQTASCKLGELGGRTRFLARGPETVSDGRVWRNRFQPRLTRDCAVLKKQAVPLLLHSGVAYRERRLVVADVIVAELREYAERVVQAAT